MGTSFVEFEDNGFWTADAWLQVWLGCLVSEVDRLSEVPIWLREWRDQSHMYASNYFLGCVSAGLTNFLDNEQRRQIMISLCEQAANRLDECGINAAEIEVEWVEAQSDINDVVQKGVLSTRRAFVRLLERRLDEYELDSHAHWKLNQVAPVRWWRGPSAS